MTRLDDLMATYSRTFANAQDRLAEREDANRLETAHHTIEGGELLRRTTAEAASAVAAWQQAADDLYEGNHINVESQAVGPRSEAAGRITEKSA